MTLHPSASHNNVTRNSRLQATPDRRSPRPPEVGVARPESPAVSGPGSALEAELASCWLPGPDCAQLLANMAATPGTFYPARSV